MFNSSARPFQRGLYSGAEMGIISTVMLRMLGVAMDCTSSRTVVQVLGFCRAGEPAWAKAVTASSL